MSDHGSTIARRRVLGGLAVVGAGLAALVLAGRKAHAALSTTTKPGDAGVTVGDLARPRASRLPRGGTYDHTTQEMKDYRIDVAGTSTGGGEDDCCQSTTFWDGEKS